MCWSPRSLWDFYPPAQLFRHHLHTHCCCATVTLSFSSHVPSSFTTEHLLNSALRLQEQFFFLNFTHSWAQVQTYFNLCCILTKGKITYVYTCVCMWVHLRAHTNHIHNINYFPIGGKLMQQIFVGGVTSRTTKTVLYLIQFDRASLSTTASPPHTRASPPPHHHDQKKTSGFYSNAFIYQDFNDQTLEFVFVGAACRQTLLPSAGCRKHDIFIVLSWWTWGRGGGRGKVYVTTSISCLTGY